MATKKLCAHGNKSFCPFCSRIKLVVTFKNEYKHLYGNKNSATRYSIMSDDRKPEEKIMDKMEGRLLERGKNHQPDCFEGHYNVAKFTDNKTGVVLREIRAHK